jgi:hypothetical protein
MKLNDYEWRQLSMWDFSPDTCIEKYIRSTNGNDIFHFYLVKCSEMVSDTQWKIETVIDSAEVPNAVLMYRDTGYWIKRSGKKSVYVNT